MTHERLKMTDQLTVALGYCELLLMNAYDAMTDRQREIVQQMALAATGAKNIVRTTDSGFTSD